MVLPLRAGLRALGACLLLSSTAIADSREPDLGWRVAGAGRFDADAHTDLVWRNEGTGELRVWLMNGSAKAAESGLQPASAADLGWRVVGVADLNADGRGDLVFRNQTSGRNVVWLMGGLIRAQGAFTDPSTLQDANWYVGGVADLGAGPLDPTPDGKPDLVWRHALSGRNVVWFMNGLARTAGAYTQPDLLADANWRIVGAADLGSNGSDVPDGRNDLVWQHALSGRVVVWRMNGLARVQGLFTTPDSESDAAWRVSAVGDLSGDGGPDLLWRHGASGALQVWVLNGATRTATLGVSEPPAGPRGFPAPGPWVSFYGPAEQMGGLPQAAAAFRILNVDADPGVGNFTPQQIQTLKNGGQNRVISYLNVGACESWREYWTSAPGFVSCGANTAAQLGPYDGYPDETWMNPANAAYRQLIVGYVAPRLVAQGVDGFFLDNLEIVEHGTQTTNGPCNAACSQGGLDLVYALRQAFPDKLIVMQNATSDVTRLGTTNGVAYTSLLDGISHEEVFAPAPDTQAQQELSAWRDLALKPGGRPFWIGTEDYVGSCTSVAAAQAVYLQSRSRAFSPYASDASAGQQQICYWGF